MNGADLDGAVFGRDAQIGAHSGGAVGFVEEREEERVLAGCVPLETFVPFIAAGRWMGGEIGPEGHVGWRAE